MYFFNNLGFWCFSMYTAAEGYYPIPTKLYECHKYCSRLEFDIVKGFPLTLINTKMLVCAVGIVSWWGDRKISLASSLYWWYMVSARWSIADNLYRIIQYIGFLVCFVCCEVFSLRKKVFKNKWDVMWNWTWLENGVSVNSRTLLRMIETRERR